MGLIQRLKCLSIVRVKHLLRFHIHSESPKDLVGPECYDLVQPKFSRANIDITSIWQLTYQKRIIRLFTGKPFESLSRFIHVQTNVHLWFSSLVLWFIFVIPCAQNCGNRFRKKRTWILVGNQILVLLGLIQR